MSLLMDALRRAEEAKRQAIPTGNPATSPLDLHLDPLDAPTSAPSQALPPLSRHLGDADSGSASAAATPRRRRTAPTAAADTANDQSAERTGARNLFAVKQLPRSRRGLWLFLGLGGLAMLVIGGYVWWQLQSIASGSPTRPIPPPLPASTQPALPPGPTPPPVLTATAPPQLTTAVEPPRLAPAPRAAATRSERVRRESIPQAGASGVFRPGSRQERSDQTLNLAYEDWQAGRLDEARRGYEQVLRSDARNTDALLGLAAIAARQGQLERAQSLYLRVIESDPTDATAQAALINLRVQGDAGPSESRLRTLLASQPDSSALYFSLGNLYARQGRWNDAQQAYFQAYALEPDNADYIFNVAVSLDHLRQNKLAAQYYRMALSAAETGRGAFDRHAAGKRILELQP